MSLHEVAVTTEAGTIELNGVDIYFGEGERSVRALDSIDLRVERGELVSVLGPSGCGKSTIIGAIAGFTPISAGDLRVDAQRIAAPGPDRGVVFQQHALFPWKTVLANVEFGLKMRGVSKRERREIAHDILQHIGLGEFV
ncbi:MAG TPA: ATP-binding cassette domain-containing protein, partial [Polyangiales bacterium]|nr:ATP-binding cassette domain-containing protein [Polyangiales bacterium]